MEKKKKKALIVDDDNNLRLMLKLMLETTGYDVVEADNGQKSVEKARTESPDFIIMDIMMPGMNGIEAVRQLKSKPETRSIPVIMLTALAESESVLDSYDSGAEYYLSKPFDSKSLQKAIEFVDKLQRSKL